MRAITFIGDDLYVGRRGSFLGESVVYHYEPIPEPATLSLSVLVLGLIALRLKLNQRVTHGTDAILQQAVGRDGPAPARSSRSAAASLGGTSWRLMENGQNAEAAMEYQKSLVIYRELAREFPDVTRYDISARACTSDLARALLNSGQQSEAEQLAMEFSPRTGSDFVQRGNIYRELRQDDKAIADFDKALETGLDGQIPPIRRVGEFLAKVGQHEKAILFYNHDVQMHPDPIGTPVGRTYAQRGASRARLKQYDKALARLLLSLAPLIASIT